MSLLAFSYWKRFPGHSQRCYSSLSLTITVTDHCDTQHSKCSSQWVSRWQHYCQDNVTAVAGPRVWNRLPLISKPSRTLVFLGANFKLFYFPRHTLSTHWHCSGPPVIYRWQHRLCITVFYCIASRELLKIKLDFINKFSVAAIQRWTVCADKQSDVRTSVPAGTWRRCQAICESFCTWRPTCHNIATQTADTEWPAASSHQRQSLSFFAIKSLYPSLV